MQKKISYRGEGGFCCIVEQYERYEHFTHLHDWFEYLFCRQGEIRLQLDGKPVTLCAGDSILIFPMQIHSLQIPAGSDACILTFSGDLVPEFRHILSKRMLRCDAPFQMQSFINDYAFSRLQDYENATLLTLHVCCGMLCNEFLTFAPKLTTLEQNKLYTKTVDYINTHYAQKLTLSMVAEAVHANADYLSRLLIRYNGIRFSEYLRLIRVNKAAQLIKDTDKKLYEIAEAVGYMNMRSFNRDFKRILGMPSAYKRSFGLPPHEKKLEYVPNDITIFINE